MRGVTQDLTGQKFGRLTVTGKCKVEGRSGLAWHCQCDCGKPTSKPIVTSSLLRLTTQSCGCLMVERVKETNSTHKLTLSPTYISWKSMWSRCTYKKHKSYKYYKNFVPVDRWKVFENFLHDMGQRPSLNHSLDRIDNSKGYFPENCRWSSRFEQQFNRDVTIVVEINGQSLSLRQAAIINNINYGTVKRRVRSGISPIDAVTKPVRSKFRSNDLNTKGHIS